MSPPAWGFGPRFLHSTGQATTKRARIPVSFLNHQRGCRRPAGTGPRITVRGSSKRRRPAEIFGVLVEQADSCGVHLGPTSGQGLVRLRSVIEEALV